jgi:hypothetical protein
MLFALICIYDDYDERKNFSLDTQLRIMRRKKEHRHLQNNKFPRGKRLGMNEKERERAILFGG